jgi:hypothetical protein
MKFMATWSVPQDKWLSVLKKWVSMSPQERTNAGEGVRIVGRWFDTAARSGVGIFESSDLAAVSRYIAQWNSYMEITLVPVLDEEEVTAVAQQIVADNNA